MVSWTPRLLTIAARLQDNFPRIGCLSDSDRRHPSKGWSTGNAPKGALFVSPNASTTGGPDEAIATMARWFAEFGLFFSDIWRHTVGRLSGVLSIVLAILGFALPAFFAGEPGLRHSRWAFELAALLAFILAAYSAWKEQHRQAVEQHQKVVETLQKLDDRRPRIAFSVAPSRPTYGNTLDCSPWPT